MSQAQPLIISASPRAGNSKLAAEIFAAECSHYLQQNKTLYPERLSDYKVLPCTDCGQCLKPDKECPHAQFDESKKLFSRLLTAPMVMLSAPIYFYHVPAALKSFIDRCQLYYNAMLRKDAGYTGLKPRKAWVILISGREQGEQLFNGSMLSLKYALAPFKLEVEALFLRGLDAQDSLKKNQEQQLKIKNFAIRAMSMQDTAITRLQDQQHD